MRFWRFSLSDIEREIKQDRAQANVEAMRRDALHCIMPRAAVMYEDYDVSASMPALQSTQRDIQAAKLPLHHMAGLVYPYRCRPHLDRPGSQCKRTGRGKVILSRAGIILHRISPDINGAISNKPRAAS